MKRWFSLAVSLVALSSVLPASLFVSGCGRHSPGSAPQAAATPSLSPTHFTPNDLAKLKWIEGTWRGTGEVEKPFFERYRFENATTLLVDSFDDEKVDKVTDTTRFELKDGQLVGGSDDSRYAASVIDDESITFEPVFKARNSFTWKRESKDVWQAILKWPAAGGKSAGQRIYRMERWPPAK